MSLQAQIDRQIDDYQKRPRKKFIGANAQEYRFAQYEEDWRLKVERVGTLNYPAEARGKHYGHLRLTVTIRPDVNDFDILEIAFREPYVLAEEVVSYGSSVIMVSPDDVRAIVVARLRALVAEPVPG